MGSHLTIVPLLENYSLFTYPLTAVTFSCNHLQNTKFGVAQKASEDAITQSVIPHVFKFLHQTAKNEGWTELIHVQHCWPRIYYNYNLHYSSSIPFISFNLRMRAKVHKTHILQNTWTRRSTHRKPNPHIFYYIYDNHKSTEKNKVLANVWWNHYYAQLLKHPKDFQILNNE